MKKISVNELKQMGEQEGLILQGCGGDLGEWVDGISQMLTERGVLREGSAFSEVYAFEHDGLTNLLFPFDNVDLDIGKLAMWRLATREDFGGAWLSDYLPNMLGHTPVPREDDCEMGMPAEQEM